MADCVPSFRPEPIFLEVSEWSHLPCDLSYRFLEFTSLGMLLIYYVPLASAIIYKTRLLGTLKCIVKMEGVRGLYRGILP
ncbi:hypothetical protein AALP_AA5G069000 [Arabis alpina]|uniref:Uncharacterized protein n=1 Tax=Arabis alpina TaxID=50452 RepID=A0A087GVF4_ARAAL|nr:hypothetical protein AALP_AA5G069000 [Arabis alpina]